MLFFLHGTDTDKAREKAHEMLASLHKKKPEAELFRLDADNWDEIRLDELVGAQGLFERKFIVFVNRLFDNKEAKEVLLKKLPAIAESENVFIFLDGKVDKATLVEITEVAEKVQLFEKTEAKKPQSFNIFSLADAFGERDRKALWVIYQKAVRNDASPEELSGILFWQIKNLMLARESASASEASLNPFVFGKSKRYSRNFSLDELAVLALELVTLYHSSHRGQVDFEAGIERFVLKV
ncbi:MAG: hypothetical protein Q7R65_04760 [bacterium]|nr:hypothetical protein [bacterium]